MSFGVYAPADFHHPHGFPNVDPEERGGTKIHYLYLQPVALDLIRKLVSKHHAQQRAAHRPNRKHHRTRYQSVVYLGSLL